MSGHYRQIFAGPKARRKGTAAFDAIHPDPAPVVSTLHAISVRMSGGDNFCNVVCYYPELPAALHKKLLESLCTPTSTVLNINPFSLSLRKGQDSINSVDAKVVIDVPSFDSLPQVCRIVVPEPVSVDIHCNNEVAPAILPVRP